MEIILYRHPGYLGRAVPLDVFVNGERVAAIQSGTSLKIFIPDGDATLKVEMKGAVTSPAFNVSSHYDSRAFECGTRLWVLLDVINLCYLPFLKRHDFFIRPARPSLSNA